MPGDRCATCITYSTECTYDDPPKVHDCLVQLSCCRSLHPTEGPTKRVGIVDGGINIDSVFDRYAQLLEARLAKLEQLVQTVSA